MEFESGPTHPLKEVEHTLYPFGTISPDWVKWARTPAISEPRTLLSSIKPGLKFKILSMRTNHSAA
jgi:hypothetical protein